MTIDTDDFLNSILGSLSRIDYIKPEDIPDIELYMDQVTTFMDSQLRSSKRHEDNKILTKTMINNYAKNNLLPPPIKKKYSKEHILTLIFIYYFKNILSITDIQTLLDPITKTFFKKNGSLSLEQIYNEVFYLEKNEVTSLQADITKKFKIAMNTFQNAPKDEKDFLQLFAFICILSFDVYVKKQLIESLVDMLVPPTSSNEKKSEKDKNKAKD